MAFELVREPVGWPLDLARKCGNQAVQAIAVGRGHCDRAAAAAREQPLRPDASALAASQHLVAEADDRPADRLRSLEDVHLAAADHRDGARPHGHGVAVDQVLALARTHPDELVIVVAVWLTRALRRESGAVEQHHLEPATGVKAVRRKRAGRGHRANLALAWPSGPWAVCADTWS